MSERLRNFEKVTEKLEEALQFEAGGMEREVAIEIAIKRFELCFELAWKLTKKSLRMRGVDAYSPRDCLKEAFMTGLIEYGKVWIEMIDDRNLAVHIYNEEVANRIYKHLPSYAKAFRQLLDKLKKEKFQEGL